MNTALILSLALCVTLAIWLPKVESFDDNSCTRTDGKHGFCVHNRECPKILKLFRQRQRLPEEATYLRNSRCPVHKKGFVCCEEVEISAGLQVLLDQDCGRFGSIGLTIGGKEVGLMSRPWMALLKFKTQDGIESFECGGTLITKRHILTAAHCFKNSDMELVSVRLGEHKISAETDCAKNSRHALVCAPPFEDFRVEHVFKHEQYSQEKFLNDIALIKLSTDVEYKINIRPICLPVNRELQQRVDKFPNYRVSGWGRTEHEYFSDVLNEVFIPRKNRSECATAFGKEINVSQICAGKLEKDSCNGDSGGPLMYSTEYKEVDRFVQFGVVSYGSRECGNGSPGVYTSVGSFIPWIADQISNDSILPSYRKL